MLSFPRIRAALRRWFGHADDGDNPKSQPITQKRFFTPQVCSCSILSLQELCLSVLPAKVGEELVWSGNAEFIDAVDRCTAKNEIWHIRTNIRYTFITEFGPHLDYAVYRDCMPGDQSAWNEILHALWDLTWKRVADVSNVRADFESTHSVGNIHHLKYTLLASGEEVTDGRAYLETFEMNLVTSVKGRIWLEPTNPLLPSVLAILNRIGSRESNTRRAPRTFQSYLLNNSYMAGWRFKRYGMPLTNEAR